MRPLILAAALATFAAGTPARADCPTATLLTLYNALYAADSNGDAAGAQGYANRMWTLTDNSSPDCSARQFMAQNVAPSYPDPANSAIAAAVSEHADMVMEVATPANLHLDEAADTATQPHNAGEPSDAEKTKMRWKKKPNAKEKEKEKVKPVLLKPETAQRLLGT